MGDSGQFVPSRDEPWRPQEPTSLAEAGVLESNLEQLILKYLLARGDAEGRRIADQVKLPFRLVEPVLESLKTDQSVAYRRGTEAGDYLYALTDRGRAQGRNFSRDCTYFGACPVPLDDYIASVKQQTVEGQKPRREELLHAFSDLLIGPGMLDRLGPAINSGRGMFLYGFPGNGKTSIAERVTAAFGKYIWIPRAVDIDGDVMRVFDPMSHEVEMPEVNSGLLDHSGYDKRWIRIRRPTLVAGGELTMEMLEVQSNPSSNINEAPLQMKSNCGTLVIDDFGRQKMSIDQLLNRWIVPLEKRFDFLNMPSGKKIQVPFDQLVIFSTNLEPRDLVDDAFLRRIPYKIEVLNPSEADFRQLFKIMCGVLKIPYREEPIDYLIRQHYLPIERPFRNCQPRDLLLQVQNYCRYHDREVELRDEYFDFAVENYFSIM
jgi:predicted ATPase with chaperone activity